MVGPALAGWPKEVHDFLLTQGFSYILKYGGYIHERFGLENLRPQEHQYVRNPHVGRGLGDNEVFRPDRDLLVDFIEGTEAIEAWKKEVEEIRLENQQLVATLEARDKMISRMKLRRPLPRRKQ